MQFHKRQMREWVNRLDTLRIFAMARLQEKEIKQVDDRNRSKIINLDDINDPAALITTVSADKQEFHDVEEFLHKRFEYAIWDWVFYSYGNNNMTFEEIRKMMMDRTKFSLDGLEDFFKENH